MIISKRVITKITKSSYFVTVKRLLSAGVDPNSANADGLSALHQCCIDNSPSILQLLIQYGADVNRRDAEMWTVCTAQFVT